MRLAALTYRSLAIAAVAAFAVLVACSSSPSPARGQSSSQQPTTPPATPTSSADSPSASETDSSTPTTSDSDTSEPSSTATGSVVLAPGRGGSALALADFFEPDSEWTEGSYDLADHKGIQGIAATVDNCSLTSALPLELRLADNYKTFTFEAGEANDSKASDQTLTIAVQANGKQVTAKNIPFNRVQDFSIDVTSVNSLKLLFYVGPQCGSSVNAIIFKATVN